MAVISGQDVKCLNKETLSILIFAEPLIAYYLMRSKIVEDPKLPACAGITVKDKAIRLYLNPKDFNAMTRSQQLGVLIHEYLHVLFLHVTKRHQSDFIESEWHRITCNWGLDLSINQLIVKHYDLPDYVLMPDNKQFMFPFNLSADKYINLCREKFPRKVIEITMTGTSKDSKDSKDKKETNEGQGNIKGFDDHSKWNSSSNENEDTSNTIIKEIAKSYAKSKMGTEPGSVLRGSNHGSVLEELLALETNSVNWRQEIKKFIFTTTESFKKIDYKRYSRRLGFPSPGKKRKRKCHLKIICDTSGSMVTEFLQKMAGELNLLSKIAKLDIYQCDTEVTDKISNFKPSKSFTVKGRGGTVLQPAFTEAFEDGADGIICFTDGYIDQVDTQGTNTLWVIINNNNFEQSSGRVVHIKW